MKRESKTREEMISAATERFRRDGYVGTSVDDICAAAGVTKGAFFHYFKNKEALAEACLAAWDRKGLDGLANAPFHQMADPVEKLLACLDELTKFFTQPGFFQSCLAGTTIQEVSQSNPRLRKAAHACLAGGCSRLQGLMEQARASRGLNLDAASLASFWMATLQGAFILAKGAQDENIVRAMLTHARAYIAGLFDA